MTREGMKSRTKEYANRIVRVCAALPNNWGAQTLGKQLLRSGTSMGANYRAVCRAKSNSDFIHKLRIVEEECDVGVFLRLGAAELPQAQAGNVLAEDVGHFRGLDVGHVNRQAFFVGG